MHQESLDSGAPRGRWTAVGRVRHRLAIIVGVMLWCGWAIYPPAERMKLGLDLKGGVHLVLRVDADSALAAETRAAAERLRQTLTDAGVPFSSIAATGTTEITANGIPDSPAFRAAAAETDAAFARELRSGAAFFSMRPAVADDIRERTVQQAQDTIERRVNDLGVSEAVVARYSEADQVLVQLPGVSEVERAKQIIKSTAQLRLTLVERGPFASREAAQQAYGNALPPAFEVLLYSGGGSDPARSDFYVVHTTPAVTGADLRDARQAFDEFNRPAVAFTLTQDAAARFGEFTSGHIQRTLATVLDGRIRSLATIVDRIDDRGQIAGVTRDEMLEQVITLKSGALPADLAYVEEHTVGASLGDAAIRSGVAASLGGLALVVLFMVAYYRRAGLNAFVSIVVNLLILLAFVAVIPVTLTLPGIAGLILTIGMGVDSNVLIFERIREELAQARGARTAVRAGFDRVWITIVDTHVTSLIAAALLFQFGTSSIKGFATTLTIGLLANVFTSVFVSRTLFELMLTRGGRPLTMPNPMAFIAKTPVNVSRLSRYAIALSVLVIAAGMAAIATNGLRLGTDFSGGTAIVAEFDRPVSDDDVREAVAMLPGEEIVQQYGSRDERRVLIRLPDAAPAPADGSALEASAQFVTDALRRSGLPHFEVVDRALVTATIGGDQQRRGVYAVAASIVAVTAYIAMRFRWSFAIGGIAATMHDVLVTLACLSLAGYDLSLNVTAALLTIIGYSVNDTIVLFDRVRENLRRMRGTTLQEVVNLSVNQTLARTFITAGTTFLSVLALYLYGGEALRGFAFTMLVGIVSGTYSTVFIASAIAGWLGDSHKRNRV
jgi:protein-export membrane protein SecD/preprotein translocase SecF subunit